MARSEDYLLQFVQLPSGLGLLDARESRWTDFKAEIDQLNANAPEGTSYKVFFLGRHGQGFREYPLPRHADLLMHKEDNVAELKYGTKVGSFLLKPSPS